MELKWHSLHVDLCTGEWIMILDAKSAYPTELEKDMAKHRADEPIVSDKRHDGTMERAQQEAAARIERERQQHAANDPSRNK